ncbi:MAG: beta-N-acetylhexosaminidase [bacterium]
MGQNTRIIKYGGFLFLVFMLVACGRNATVTELNIVPEPVFMVQKDGSFTLGRNISVAFNGIGQNSPVARHILKALRHNHLHPSLVSTSEKNDIELVVNDIKNPELGDEGYLLEVRQTGIRLSANSETGLFYAYQTLIQMIPPDISKHRYSSITLPVCTILDHPRFEWRGAHLDVCRHFFPVKFIKKYLDVMASYKMNRFHWHLTDDHGWRLPSDKYPLLNEIGSWRVDRDNQPWDKADPPEKGERTSYGGFYTKEEISEIVEYATALGIEIIPEIELPGHCSAILASYPRFSCNNGHYDIPIGPYWPPKAILCAGNDSTLLFIQDILDEVMALFPSKYIHIGGDEAVKDMWKHCPKCQRRIVNEHLHDEEHLQGWMMRKVADYLHAHGRIPIGWDEALDCGGLGADAIIMAWRSSQAGQNAARLGNKVIMCPTEYCYLDYYQADRRYQPPAIGGLITLAKAYQFDPAPIGTNSYVAESIIGGQCNLWSEYINTPSHAEYMLLPRMLAISECLWSQPQSKDWNRFRKKIEIQKQRLASKGYNYCEGSFTPIFHATHVNDQTTNIAIETEVPNTYIFYTTDTTTPTHHSPVYIGPINLRRGTHIKILPVYKDIARDSVYEFVIK